MFGEVFDEIEIDEDDFGKLLSVWDKVDGCMKIKILGWIKKELRPKFMKKLNVIQRYIIEKKHGKELL